MAFHGVKVGSMVLVDDDDKANKTGVLVMVAKDPKTCIVILICLVLCTFCE